MSKGKSRNHPPGERTGIIKKPATSFVVSARLIAARQDARLVSMAGIQNGMSQDECDERLLAIIGTQGEPENE